MYTLFTIFFNSNFRTKYPNKRYARYPSPIADIKTMKYFIHSIYDIMRYYHAREFFIPNFHIKFSNLNKRYISIDIKPILNHEKDPNFIIIPRKAI